MRWFEMNKEDVIKFTKECDMCDMYDIFDVCRERHNDKMMEGH